MRKKEIEGKSDVKVYLLDGEMRKKKYLCKLRIKK